MARVVVRIPTALRLVAGGAHEAVVDAVDVASAIGALDAAHPGMASRVLRGAALGRFVNVYVGEEDVRFLDGLATRLDDGDVLTLVAAVAGG